MDAAYRSVTETSTTFSGREIWLKRAFASLIPMIRTILELPSVVADYTVGTVIVFVQLTRWKRDRRLRIAA